MAEPEVAVVGLAGDTLPVGDLGFDILLDPGCTPAELGHLGCILEPGPDRIHEVRLGHILVADHLPEGEVGSSLGCSCLAQESQEL